MKIRALSIVLVVLLVVSSCASAGASITPMKVEDFTSYMDYYLALNGLDYPQLNKSKLFASATYGDMSFDLNDNGEIIALYMPANKSTSSFMLFAITILEGCSASDALSVMEDMVTDFQSSSDGQSQCVGRDYIMYLKQSASGKIDFEANLIQ